jgi:hypothetical protein
MDSALHKLPNAVAAPDDLVDLALGDLCDLIQDDDGEGGADATGELLLAGLGGDCATSTLAEPCMDEILASKEADHHALARNWSSTSLLSEVSVRMPGLFL